MSATAELSISSSRAGRLGYAWWVVTVLMLAYTLSFIDRQILSLLVQPLRAELALSDTRVGLLQGVAFALFYTLLGLPMGRLVDRFNRRNLIAAGIALWSAMTALCGLARSFGALFAARMGVGVGEATLSPAALSIITDSFPKEKLGTAISVYSLGIFIGSGLAFLVGGAVVTSVGHLPPLEIPLLGEISSWRLAFLIVGLPGLLTAGLIRALREPARTGVLVDTGDRPTILTFRQTLQEISHRAVPITGISAGMACHAICMYGVLAWIPTFFVRCHAWTAGKAGSALGLIVLVFGCAGMYCGGRLCDRWQARGVRSAPLRVGAIGIALAGGGVVSSVLARADVTSLLLLAPALFGLALPIGSLFAGLQLILPNQIRGQVSALYLFVISLVGISLGPLLPGVLSDRVFDDPARIGDALAITCGAAAIGAVIAFRAAYRPYEVHAALQVNAAR